MPWIHLFANPDGTVLPCCVGDWQQSMGNVQNTKLEDVFNNEKFKQMRKNMLAGKNVANVLHVTAMKIQVTVVFVSTATSSLKNILMMQF